MASIVAPSRMEPLRIEDPSAKLIAKAEKVRGLGERFFEEGEVKAGFALNEVMAVVSAWHSSKIEGRTCDPKLVFKSLAGAAAENPIADEVAALARLHMKINEDYRGGTLNDPSSLEWIANMHASFCAASLDLSAKRGSGRFRECDVIVGGHVAPPFDRVEAFLEHFWRRFRADHLKGRVTSTLALASAHHRLSWIHPFEDGNGRVARLYSHAFACKAGLGANGLWSLPRALSIGVEGRPGYLEMMTVADRPRQGDRDGRGNLSLMGLESFTDWFLHAVLVEMHRAQKERDAFNAWAEGSDLRLEDFVNAVPTLFSSDG